jgi:hypothetical protein
MFQIELLSKKIVDVEQGRIDVRETTGTTLIHDALSSLDNDEVLSNRLRGEKCELLDRFYSNLALNVCLVPQNIILLTQTMLDTENELQRLQQEAIVVPDIPKRIKRSGFNFRRSASKQFSTSNINLKLVSIAVEHGLINN